MNSANSPKEDAMQKTLNVGMIGYGFMGRAHSNAYKQVGQFFPSEHKVVLKAACARDEGKISEFAKQWGYESIETDWKKLIARPDIDVIDICTPNNLHKEIALAAAKAGKMILCEKPLAMNAVEGEEMVEAVEKAGVANMVWYNYRRIPAVTLAKKLIEEGRLGRIFHYRAKFLQDWTIKADLPQGGQGLWRLDVAAAGSGVSGDLLAHCIDTAVWLNGSIKSLCCMTETFVKERMHNLTGKVEKVSIDDACLFMGKFANGSLANFESTRYARGHKAQYTFEINGEDMSIFWDLHDLHRLSIFDYKDEGKIRGWKSIHVTDNSPDHPYMANWWVPGLAIGYDSSFTHQVADFIMGLETGKPQGPTFRDALETQRILDAMMASAKSQAWVDV
jgi:predicted dehydrogenase